MLVTFVIIVFNILNGWGHVTSYNSGYEVQLLQSFNPNCLWQLLISANVM